MSEPMNEASKQSGALQSEWAKWAVRANKHSERPSGPIKTRLSVTRNRPHFNIRKNIFSGKIKQQYPRSPTDCCIVKMAKITCPTQITVAQIRMRSNSRSNENCWLSGQSKDAGLSGWLYRTNDITVRGAVKIAGIPTCTSNGYYC